MSMIDTQNGYDLGYTYCKVCEDWSQVEHDHERSVIWFRCLSCAFEWVAPPIARPCLACGATRIEMLENP